MELKIRGADFSALDARKKFVGFLSGTVDAGMTCSFEPYQANSFDDREWVFDRGNNWRVGFPEGESAVIDIRYRYQCEQVQAEEALASWLAFRMDAEKVPNVERNRPAAGLPDDGPVDGRVGLQGD